MQDELGKVLLMLGGIQADVKQLKGTTEKALTKLDVQDERIDKMEKREAWRLGWVAGVAGLAGLLGNKVSALFT